MINTKIKSIILYTLILIFCTFAVSATTLVSVGNNVIRDTDGNLEWINHPFTSRTWSDQTTAVAALTYNGVNDWRLPTCAELLTLVSSTHSPQIDPLFHLGAVGSWSCWSSEAVTSNSILRKYSDKTRAYLIFFGDGRILHAAKKNYNAALYIRDFSTNAWQWNNGTEMVWNNGTAIDQN